MFKTSSKLVLEPFLALFLLNGSAMKMLVQGINRLTRIANLLGGLNLTILKQLHISSRITTHMPDPGPFFLPPTKDTRNDSDRRNCRLPPSECSGILYQTSSNRLTFCCRLLCWCLLRCCLFGCCLFCCFSIGCCLFRCCLLWRATILGDMGIQTFSVLVWHLVSFTLYLYIYICHCPAEV